MAHLTPEQSAIVDREYADLVAGYLASNHRRKVEIIDRAFKFARKAHYGVRRRSGEPYILHPIAVAKIVSREIGLGSTSICAALLHDVVEDTDYTFDDIEQQFGPKIAGLVEGLTKISGGIFGDRASAQAENFRKLLLTMSHDIRVVLVKMADRLHNMRTLGSMTPNKQYKIAGETLYIYAPLAHRLGLFAIKTELEDLSFKYEHPRDYEHIASLLRDGEDTRRAVYNDFARPIHEKLREMGVSYEAKDRLKSIYSIWRKMQSKHVAFEEIYDIYAMRIIFDPPADGSVGEKEMCYRIYAALTDLYHPHPERTRDWVSVPKANGYSALHVTLMGPDGNWVEVQIRSRRMDEIAEKGFAAHWKYKIGADAEEESELTVWLRTIKDILDDPNPNSLDFLDTLKLNLFASEIVVFTPKGELLTLPADATVLDVAYTLHTELGNHCIAGKVNHKLVPLSHKLSSGDQVEVLTSRTQTPHAEWASFLSTAKAKSRLRKELRRLRQPAIDSGRDIFNRFLAENNITLNNDVLTKILGRYQVGSRDELFYKLGSGEAGIDDYLNVNTSSRARSLVSRLFKLGFRKGKGNNKPARDAVKQPETSDIDPHKIVELHDADGEGREANYVVAPCCRPIPGDDVMGYLRPDGNLEIHALTCPEAEKIKATQGPRLVAVKWTDTHREFVANLCIEGVDRRGVLQEIAGVISTHMDIDMRRLNIEAHGEVFSCELDVKVRHTAQVDELCAKILKIDGVKRADRLKVNP